MVAAHITQALSIPTIGIGAGSQVDGQVLVMHDALGFKSGASTHTPKFVRHFADAHQLFTQAVDAFTQAVQAQTYPSSDETYFAHKTFTFPKRDAAYGSF